MTGLGTVTVENLQLNLVSKIFNLDVRDVTLKFIATSIFFIAKNVVLENKVFVAIFFVYSLKNHYKT